MQNKLNKLFASAIDTALIETDLTWQERVANGAVKVWEDTQQNEPFAISETDANGLAFNAQRKDSLARNKRLNVQIKVPDAIGYSHKDFATFDNNVARLKLTIINAPHLAKALKIVDKLIVDGVIGQKNLVLHKAMEAVGAGTGETWNADKRKGATDSTAARAKREADKITAEGFTTRLAELLKDAGENHMALGDPGTDQEYVFKEIAPETVKHIIDNMPDATPEVLDKDALAKMMELPEFGQAMAAFMTKLATK